VNAPSLPLSKLLSHTADAVAAVRVGRSLTDALARTPGDARPGTQALAFEVLRKLGSAEAVRRQLAPKAPPPPVDALLCSALALLWPDASGEGAGYAPHTLVDQAVEAAKQRQKASASFVNAVLRRFLREQAAIVATALKDPVARYNHPRWWMERLHADWPGRSEALLDANNHRAPMTLRINARRDTPQNYVQRLAAAGLSGRVVGPQAVVLDRPAPVSQLPGFADGEVSVQDAAAQLAAPLLIAGDQGEGLPAGARVLDACSAPGGKTAHLLELADLDVLSLDVDAERLRRVDDTLSRLHLQAETRAADAAQPATWWDGRPFDAILLDAPCSASGIVRRHPDVRWLRRPGDVAALAKIQAALLDALWPLLKPGGRLLYCTCSVFKAEGQAAIDAFLQRHPGVFPPAPPASPGHLLPLPDNDFPVTVLDSGAGPDGFFYALLQTPPHVP
jgi:16S rRNA (cytosine967-C5)-methyltransferase